MKSLKEALVHKHMDRYQSFTKQDLKPGYVVRYRGQDLAMYMDHDTTAKIKTIASRMKPGNMFIYKDHNEGINGCYMSLEGYNDNLIKMRTTKFSIDFDIIEVYPIKNEPELLNQEQLNDLIKNTKPIKINQ